jgi:DNA modification methylase
VTVAEIIVGGHGVIYTGDAISVLRGLPENSVHCCVTSPPYWGLRDYGTGQWVGGLPDCDHQNHHGEQGRTGQRADRTFTGAQNFFKNECRKCGAKRTDNQIGLEDTPQDYVARLVEVFSEVRRVLKPDGTLWLNLGDSYANDGKWGGATGGKHVSALHGEPIGRARRKTGLKPKDLIGIPWRVAFALQADGWWLRSDIVWAKPAPMPESVTDRPTRSHEYIFLLAKSEQYYYDYEAVKEKAVSSHPSGNGYKRSSRLTYQDEQGSRGSDEQWQPSPTRNLRDVWTVGAQPFPEAHFATFPPRLIEPCVIAGCPEGGTVLDPLFGAGTTGVVARKHRRKFIGIELNPEYVAMAERRMAQELLF